MKYVINHHTVAYDQWWLVHAVRCMSEKYFMQTIETEYSNEEMEDKQYRCMNGICSVDSLFGGVFVGKYKLYNPSDDDFVSLLKQDEDNAYFKEWYSRNYSRFAIWKSPDEFSHFFGIKRGVDLKNDRFKETVKKLIHCEFGIDDVVVKKIKYKPRVKLSSLYILIHGQLRRFTEIYADDKGMNQGELVFYYVYVKKPSSNHDDIESFRTEIVEKMKPVIQSLYSEVN